MITFENETDFVFSLEPLEAIANTLSTQEVELLLVEKEAMQALNLQTRGIDKPTDVLSFPLEPFPHAPLGSIVINLDAVLEVSKTLGHTPEAEIALLFIHGLLHLLGFDHESDTGQMRQKEEELIGTFGLPPSLIVRTEK
ncbi:rRNA maturation RNase YbeY [Sulfurospirillum sp. T05]|uniref:Endoribonuclease YbeY n=1 Tax=Sulfurospirillum tamanense TaxID=2813362 RepID=A0ABS2WU69_9BACT|nr:rRNA maturation RNase YbeY [Sulfurospirillum tamanensis]MBN2964734.1 rRNA maturation RNase YbeY [Sulfurospirillum tamanensis]